MHKQAELKNIQDALAKKVEYNIKILDEMDKLNAIEQTPENKKKSTNSSRFGELK